MNALSGRVEPRDGVWSVHARQPPLRHQGEPLSLSPFLSCSSLFTCTLKFVVKPLGHVSLDLPYEAVTPNREDVLSNLDDPARCDGGSSVCHVTLEDLRDVRFLFGQSKTNLHYQGGSYYTLSGLSDPYPVHHPATVVQLLSRHDPYLSASPKEVF